MNDKLSKSERIKELEELVSEQAVSLAEVVKLVSTQRLELDKLKEQCNKLQQVCSLGQ